jgi:hypothetical protein
LRHDETLKKIVLMLANQDKGYDDGYTLIKKLLSQADF